MQAAFFIQRRGELWRTHCLLWCVVYLLAQSTQVHAAESPFESRTWTDKKGNQLTSTFVDAKNGEVQLKNDAGETQKFKLADFSEPDQKYLRDLALYRRKLTAGEKPSLPADPALASFEIQPRQTITEPVPDMPPYRKPLLEFPIRIWTDVTGKKVQGKFVTAFNDKIVIDVKGNIFDLPVTRLSPEDQLYVAVQLKGLQRDDLVNVLAKAATAAQASPDGSAPAAAPAATEVAANNPAPAAPLSTDDIRARLEQLKAQREASTDPSNQVAANTPQTQPLSNDDIKARLAKIRQEREELGLQPDAIEASATSSELNRVPTMPAPKTLEQRIQEYNENMERRVQETRIKFMQPGNETRLPASGRATTKVKKCSNCGRELPESISVGDSCPGCGVDFSYDETNLAGSIGYRIGQGLGVLLMVALVVAAVKKLVR